MAIKDKELALIEKYLRSKLSTPEQKLFEQKMLDPAFAAEVGFQQDLQLAAQRSAHTDIKARLQRIEQEQASDSEQPRFIFSYKLAIAAGFALLIFASLFLINKNYSSPALAQDFYSSPIISGDRSNLSSDFESGVELFYNGTKWSPIP